MQCPFRRRHFCRRHFFFCAPPVDFSAAAAAPCSCSRPSRATVAVLVYGCGLPLASPSSPEPVFPPFFFCSAPVGIPAAAAAPCSFSGPPSAAAVAGSSCLVSLLLRLSFQLPPSASSSLTPQLQQSLQLLRCPAAAPVPCALFFRRCLPALPFPLLLPFRQPPPGPAAVRNGGCRHHSLRSYPPSFFVIHR